MDILVDTNRFKKLSELSKGEYESVLFMQDDKWREGRNHSLPRHVHS